MSTLMTLVVIGLFVFALGSRMKYSGSGGWDFDGGDASDANDGGSDGGGGCGGGGCGGGGGD